jgi:hypothetical protein
MITINLKVGSVMVINTQAVDVANDVKKISTKSLTSKFKKVLKTSDENTSQAVSQLARDALESGWVDLEIQQLIDGLSDENGVVEGGNHD